MSTRKNNPLVQIRFAETDSEIASCFRVMAQLRPHLVEDEFVARVRKLETQGYRLVCLLNDDEVRAVAGFRYLDQLARGLVLHVDDLVTDGTVRSHGYGAQLFDWLMDQAKEQRCQWLELHSSVQRYDAHRFYFQRRMKISAYHFQIPVE